MLDLGIDLDVWPWIWLGTAVVFALVELIFVGGSFIILPWAVSAFVAAILAFYDVSIEIQWGVFFFGGAVLFVGMYRWAQKFMRDTAPTPGVGAGRLVGLTGTVTAAVDPDDSDRRGRVTVAGEVWGAITDVASTLAVGTKVRVVSMLGTRVVVEPVDSGSPAGSAEEGT